MARKKPSAAVVLLVMVIAVLLICAGMAYIGYGMGIK